MSNVDVKVTEIIKEPQQQPDIYQEFAKKAQEDGIEKDDIILAITAMKKMRAAKSRTQEKSLCQ